LLINKPKGIVVENSLDINYSINNNLKEIFIQQSLDKNNSINNNLKKITVQKTSKVEKVSGIAMPQNILDSAMNELRSIEFQENMLLDIGFSKEGVQKISSEDKTKLLKTKDLPIEIQKDINKTIAKIKKNGFDETSDEYSDEIIDIMNYIISNSEQVDNIRFSLSNIPNIILNNYDYMGYTFPGIYSTEAVNGSYGTVRRVFQSFSSSHILIVEESGLNNNAGSYSIEAFINSKVYGYPSTYLIKKSPNGNTYAFLTWLIPDYDFRLYFVGDIDNQTKQILFDIANQLSKVNITEENNQTNENNDSIQLNGLN
jgi:hypothetical protein